MSAQLPLFAPEPESVYRLGGAPPDVQRRMQLAFTEPVKLELLAVAAERPDEWLGFKDFRVPMEKHKIGFCMGHVLFHLAREGRLQERHVYYNKGIGGDMPGSGHYRGFYNEWRAACPASANPPEAP